MKQPELGRKIVELRKLKGLTQEELAEKCNINVRTIQRIELGEVVPRSYTVKSIFSTLDFEVYNSNEISQTEFSDIEFRISIWLEQFLKYVIDLFNLKTEPMKKISILTILLSLIVFSVFALTKESKEKNETNDVYLTLEEETSGISSDGKMVFLNFSCENCFEDKDELIGRDVYFKYNGVTVKLELIKLNLKTKEFKTGIIDGKLFQNRLEISCPKEILNDENMILTATKTEKTKENMTLKGNAKISTSDESNYLEAEIIIINFK
jgi:transcriptional regulator with XRE-family HTH domain